VTRRMAEANPVLAVVAASVIACVLAIGCLPLVEGVIEYDRANLFLVVWAVSSAVLAGGAVGFVWPRRRRWVVVASVAVAYCGIIVPNWEHILNRARATVPGGVPWSPKPLPWPLLALVLGLAGGIAVASASAVAYLRGRTPARTGGGLAA